jgi:glycerol-3-phosphate dehydrogenase (NAD(P)+)
MSYIAVIGGGSWGTTLAVLLAEKGYDTALWVFEKEVADEINATGYNSVYLPGHELPRELKVSSDLGAVIGDARYIVSAVPTQHTRRVLSAALPHLTADTVIVSASKGIELGTFRTVSQIASEVTHHTVAVLSGPSFAKEVILKLPTAVTLATGDYKSGMLLQEIFTTSYFRVYTHDDVLGAELGGALKNVMAVAAGLSDGLGLGNNARAALITRGIAEMTRMGVFLGANETTFRGLSGIGDLVLTCSSPLSRNYTVGHKLGQGVPVGDLFSGVRSIAEGVETARAAHDLARRNNVEMPITEQVYLVLHEGKDPRRAVSDLMTRSLKAEFHG